MLPLIKSSLIAATGTPNFKSLDRIGVRAITYYMIIAVLLGIILTIRPGIMKFKIQNCMVEKCDLKKKKHMYKI